LPIPPTPRTPRVNAIGCSEEGEEDFVADCGVVG